MKQLEFVVHGRPKTQGSKTAIYNPKANKTFVRNVNSEQLSSWRSDVRNEAQKAVELLNWQVPGNDTGINIEMVFFFKRPASHYRANGELKASAPCEHTKRPDVVKLARAVEDALTGLVYRDDSQICRESLTKIYGPTCGSSDDREGVWVKISARE